MQEPLGSFQETTNQVSLREYGDVLRRRRAIILQTFVIVLVAGVLVTIFTPPTYQATARLLIEPPAYFINQLNTSDPLADLFRINQQYSILTQVEMLQTGKVREEVAKKLQSTKMPSMSVRPVEGTQIIEVVAEGETPETVASAPNTLLEIYIENTKTDRSKEVDRALKFAQDQKSNFENLANEYEKKLSAFKNKTNIIELARNKEEQISLAHQLATSYTAAQTQLALLQNRMVNTQAQIRRMEQQGQTSKSEVYSPISQPQLADLDDRVFQIQTQLRTLETQLVNPIKLDPKDVKAATEIDLPTNPTDQAKATAAAKQALARMQKTLTKAAKSPAVSEADPSFLTLLTELVRQLERKAQILDTFKQRVDRIDPVYQAMKDSLLKDSMDQRMIAQQALLLGQQLKEARDRLVQFPGWEQEWNRLRNGSDTAARNLTYFEGKIADLTLRNKTTRETAQIMQRAVPPTEPIRPKKAQNIIFAGLLGLFFGLCLALLQELFDDRINSPEEAERVLRLPSLGHIPLIEEEGLRLIKDISTFSPLMEAYRSLRTNINFAAVGNEVRSIVITSSVPAEGKSTTVANLAMAMALDNKRVIIVDADLRRPSMHKLFKVDSSPGLTDVLVGTHTIDEVMKPTNVRNVSIVPAGSPPPNPAELLGSAAMGQLLEVLESQADVVLFDSPPALAVADAIVLSARANGVLLVVGYGETKKTSTKKALETLSRANANVLGTVLNRMDGPASGYYYGKYYVPAGGERSSSKESKNRIPALEQTDTALLEGDDADLNASDKERKS